MKKIIHLSDLHVGHDECGKSFREIVSGIIAGMKPARDYIIVITGDIADNANHAEQTDEALNSIGQLEASGFRVLAIPGNHDYGTGVLGNRKFVGIFKKKYYQTKRISYPKVDIIGKTAFIGLDSTAEELHMLDRFLSEGELGRNQLRRLARILKQTELSGLKKVLYLHHHPFDYKIAMQLKDSDDLKKIIEGKVDVLLFGHYHVDTESVTRTYHGMWGINRCYNAGSSTHKNGNAGTQRVIDLTTDDPSADYDAKLI